jgi:putative FmdB family regulatory protein
MPIYEYECKKCKHRFEKIKKVSDPQEKKCPKCGGAVERLLHAPAVQFKGSGWYATDYASKGSTRSEAKAESEMDKAVKASEKPSEKSDPKPEKTEKKKK